MTSGLGLTVQITSPTQGATIDLAKTPQFSVTGQVKGFLAPVVTGVELFADGSPIGGATLDRAPRGVKTRNWTYLTSAPAGKHSLFACAHTRLGRTVGAAVTINVRQPVPSATVLAPDVAALPATAAANLTTVTDDSLVFGKATSLTVGTVVTAAPSTLAPNGLLRRITALTTSGGRTTARTVPAALDEVFWQADINVVQPITANVPAAVAKAAVETKVAAAATLPSVTFSDTVKYDKSVKGADVTGDLAFKGKVDFKLTGKIEVQVKISPHFSFTQRPRITVDHLLIRFTGSQTLSYTGTFTGSGKLEASITPEKLAKINFPAIPLWPAPPVWIAPTGQLKLGVSAAVNASMSFGASLTNTFSVGLEATNGVSRTLADDDLDGKMTDNPTGDKKATGKVKLYAQPILGLFVDSFLGPEIGIKVGLQASAELPCPGKVEAGPYLEGTVGGELQVLGKTLAKYEAALPPIGLSLYSGPFFGCTNLLSVATDSLPDTLQGDAISQQLSAANGTAPYTWSAPKGMPPGLSISTDGTITGRPSEVRAYDIAVTVKDAAGATADGVVRLTVLPIVAVPLSITTSRLEDGVVGIGYAKNLASIGGSGSGIWSLSSGDLPAGLTLAPTGAVSGTPAVTGSYPVMIKVTDAAGAIAEASFTLTVSDALPPPVLVGGSTSAPPPACTTVCGTTWGDPHQVTFDGATYDFQPEGEFVAVKSTVDDYQIQVRQQPWNGSRLVSVNVATAVMVAGNRVGVYLADGGVRLTVDGKDTALPTGPLALSGGGTLTPVPAERRLVLAWPDGSTLGVDYGGGSYLTLKVGLAGERPGSMQGLLGDADGTPGNDLTPRGGGAALAYPNPPVDQVNGTFANSWRLSQSESLFDYGPGDSTTTFTDTAFPYGNLTTTDLPAANRSAATQACTAAGVTTPALVDSCVLDVAVSGDPTLATGAATAQASISPAVLTAASAPGDPYTTPAGGTGPSVLTYGHEGCPAVDASGLCTPGSWSSLGAPWIWVSQQSTGDVPVATFTKTVNITAAQAGSTYTHCLPWPTTT